MYKSTHCKTGKVLIYDEGCTLPIMEVHKSLGVGASTMADCILSSLDIDKFKRMCENSLSVLNELESRFPELLGEDTLNGADAVDRLASWREDLLT